MPRREPYECPRCGYCTNCKTNIKKHLLLNVKPCPAVKNPIHLTQEIKEYILANRKYIISHSHNDQIKYIGYNPIIPKTFNRNNASGHIYIIWTSEFARVNDNVYKVGCSTIISKRMCQYPKNSALMICNFNTTIFETEKKLLDVFAKTFTHRKDIGSEYFQGDIEEMKELLLKTCKS
jgi:hypothetical protein